MSKPNVILIMSDNQQASTLGCYGNSEIHTPNLDAMAACGVRFDKAFCPNAFCSPCRASVLTGQMPSYHGVHSWIDDRNMDQWPKGWHALQGIPTLPELLQDQGYRTGLFGKYHLGESATPGPGWSDWVTMEHGHVRSFYENQIVDNGQKYVQPGHAVDFFTDKALDFISRDDGAPFFAYIPYPAPYGHWPATNDGMRNRFSEMYDDCPMNTVPRVGLSAETVANYNMVKENSGGGLDFSMLLRAPNNLPSLRNYYSQISMIDDAVGRILHAAPDTLIIYTADHGLSLGHHGFWGHGASTYPSNLHLAAHSIPLIVQQKGKIAPGTSPMHVSNTDLFATILDQAGIQAPDTASRSFTGLLQGRDMPDWGNDEVIAEQEETRVIRTGPWCYFKRFDKDGAPDLPDGLYNVEDDPGETINLVKAPEYADLVADLSGRIDAYFAKHARPEADLWGGGVPVQNSMMSRYWESIWGAEWAPVYAYNQ